jgi:hypothetical protein
MTTYRTLGLIALATGAVLAAVCLYLIFSAGLGTDVGFPIGVTHNGSHEAAPDAAAPLVGLAIGGILAVLGVIAIVYKPAVEDPDQLPAE